MSNFHRVPGYQIQPAGQVQANLTLSGVPAGINAQGQLVDSTGALVRDASGNPIQAVPQTTAAPLPAPVVPAPAPAPAPVTPTVTTSTTVQQPQKSLFGALFGLLISATVIAGASYIGSFYGARRAVQGPRRSSTRASRSIASAIAA